MTLKVLVDSLKLRNMLTLRIIFLCRTFLSLSTGKAILLVNLANSMKSKGLLSVDFRGAPNSLEFLQLILK